MMFSRDRNVVLPILTNFSYFLCYFIIYCGLVFTVLPCLICSSLDSGVQEVLLLEDDKSVILESTPAGLQLITGIQDLLTP